MDDRLIEALRIAVKMRSIPKETKEVINQVISLDDILFSMDWNDYEEYSDRELKALLKELFGKKEVK